MGRSDKVPTFSCTSKSQQSASPEVSLSVQTPKANPIPEDFDFFNLDDLNPASIQALSWVIAGLENPNIAIEQQGFAPCNEEFNLVTLSTPKPVSINQAELCYANPSTSVWDSDDEGQNLGRVNQVVQEVFNEEIEDIAGPSIEATVTGNCLETNCFPKAIRTRHGNRFPKRRISEFPTEIVVDTIHIPVPVWAKAYIEKNPVKAGMILFGRLFEREEIRTSTVSLRCGSTNLNVKKQTAILKACWWMRNKENKNPYPSNSTTFEYPTDPDFIREIKQKVFIEKRNEKRRKSGDGTIIKRVKRMKKE